MIEDAVPKVVKSIVMADSAIRTIAIWRIEVGANQPIDVSLLEDQLTMALIQADHFRRFQVVDRTALQIQAADLGLELPEVFDRRKMIQIGTALKIDAFLSGSAALTDEGLVLDLKLVDTKIGSFVWTDRIVGVDRAAAVQRNQLAEATQRAIEQQRARKQFKSTSEAMLRSLILPGWGQFYAKHPSRGFTYLFVEAISWGVFLQAGSNQEGTGSDTQKQVGLALVAANHLISSIDALFSAKHHNRKLRSSYDLSLQLDGRDKRVQLTYSHRF